MARTERPLVSVLMPIRDAASTLEESLLGLRRQSLSDFELIAVNDGSIDGSGAILDCWAAEDPRIRVLHLSRSGLITALNAGLQLCRSPLVARLDADDIAHPRRLELQAAFFESSTDAGVVSSLVRHFPRSHLGRGTILYEEWLNRLRSHEDMMRERFVESPVAHPSVMIRRDVLVEHGGYRDVGWPEDYDLWLRLAESGLRFAKIERSLLFWRDHPQRLTRRHPRYHRFQFLRCKAHHLVRGPLSQVGSVVLWGSGPTGRRLSRELRQRGIGIRAVVDIDPSRVGSTLHGAAIIAPGDLAALLPAVLIVAVAARGARTEIRRHLLQLGLVEGADFWCLA